MDVLLWILLVYLGIGFVIGVVLSVIFNVWRMGVVTTAIAVSYWTLLWLPHFFGKKEQAEDEDSGC